MFDLKLNPPSAIRHPLRRAAESGLGACALMAAASLVLVLALRAAGLLLTPELAAYDQLVRWRAERLDPFSPVTLVGATEDDLRRWGWPLSDERLAQLLDPILASGARVVGIDLYRDLPVPPGGDRLAALLARHDNIYGVAKIGGDGSKPVPAHPVLQKEGRVGFADIVVDPGGVVRRALLYLDEGGATYTALGLRLALKYLEAGGIKPAQAEDGSGAMRLGAAVIPPLEADDGGYVDADAAGYQFLLDYARGAAPFRTVSVSDVLDGRVPRKVAFAGKIVIIGVTAESVKDFFYTPFRHGRQADEIAHGIAMHGHVATQLVRLAQGRSPVVRTFSETLEIAWIALWTLLGAAAALAIRSPWRLASTVAAGLALIAAASWAAFARAWWLPVMPQAAGWLLAAGLTSGWLAWRERVQRGQLMLLFSRHLSEEIAGDIWSRRAEFLDQQGLPRRQRLTATVLFSDIKGFTTVSERLDPPELMDWLNRYMSAMADIVRRHGGTLNQIIGDAVMAVFGIPVPRHTDEEVARDAANAVDCALAMRAALPDVNRENAARGLPPIEIRIGIYTGPLVTGTLGSRDRMQYTMIGDTVNTASRLESFKTAEGEGPPLPDEPCRILIGDATYSRLAGRYSVTEVGVVRLKGKERGVTVYRVEGAARKEAVDRT
jgi:adenylate cyclase